MRQAIARGPQRTRRRRERVTVARLREMLNHRLQESVGCEDAVFRGPVYRVTSPRPGGANWSPHTLTVRSDHAAAAQRIVGEVRARYDVAWGESSA